VGAEEGNQEAGRNYGPCASPNVIGVITSRRMRWAGHVARMGERRNACMAMKAMPIVM
jgi:hypothetical protein